MHHQVGQPCIHNTPNHPITAEIERPIHVISIEEPSSGSRQKPPDYEAVTDAPPSYDDAIKLNPSHLLRLNSNNATLSLPTVHNMVPRTVEIVSREPTPSPPPPYARWDPRYWQSWSQQGSLRRADVSAYCNISKNQASTKNMMWVKRLRRFFWLPWNGQRWNWAERAGQEFSRLNRLKNICVQRIELIREGHFSRRIYISNRTIETKSMQR